ncbi:hypothetical protein HTG_18395 [Natrinema mahii]|nr:hypothetical protein HTG_18395 [Natrinema mahii]
MQILWGVAGDRIAERARNLTDKHSIELDTVAE